MIGVRRVIAAVACGLGLFWALVPASAAADDPGRPIRIQLKWRHQFQFAGFYAAIEQGYFRDAGLTVELIEGGPEIDPVEAVADGRAEFGVGNSGLMLDRAKGAPVRAVATVMQHSPFALAVTLTPDLDRPRDLAYRSLMLEPHAAELQAYLRLSNVPMQQVRIKPHSGDPGDLGRAVDAMSIYTADEAYDLITRKIAHQIFSPKSAGVDFYGDLLFTSDAVAARDPALVRAVRDAMIRGWSYALDHPNEIMRLIIQRYAPKIDPLKLSFEAMEIRRLISVDVIEIGYMNPKRWLKIRDLFHQAGMLPPNFNLDEFLFEPPQPVDWRLIYLIGAGAGAAVLAALSAAAAIGWSNIRLRREIIRRQQAEALLQHQATVDPLTGAYNRRYFRQRGDEEGRRRQRLGGGAAVIYLDLDHFKTLNDRWGHGVGDRALVAVAQACVGVLRDIDVFARIGGEEFAVLLPGASLATGLEIAERLRQMISGLSVTTDDGAAAPLSASFGVAAIEDRDVGMDSVYARADQALYQAKHDGRNRVRAQAL